MIILVGIISFLLNVHKTIEIRSISNARTFNMVTHLRIYLNCELRKVTVNCTLKRSATKHVKSVKSLKNDK